MHNPTQPDPTYQPPQVTERRRLAEPGSFSEPGFQPKRRDDTDKSMPPQQSPGSLAGNLAGAIRWTPNTAEPPSIYHCAGGCPGSAGPRTAR